MNCPFRLCTAWVTLVVEQARPDDDELTVSRVPSHELEGVNGYTAICPASMLVIPLYAEAAELLEQQAETIESIVRDREQEQSDPVPVVHEPGQHRKTPDAKWFKGHQGDNPRGEFIEGLQVMRPQPVPRSQEGQPSTVGESHAVEANGLIQAAKEKIGEIQTSISGLTNNLETTIAGVATFAERGNTVVAMILQAAEGSQTHDYRIQESTATVQYATNVEASSVIAAAQQALAQLNDLYGKLASAHNQLSEIVF